MSEFTCWFSRRNVYVVMPAENLMAKDMFILTSYRSQYTKKLRESFSLSVHAVSPFHTEYLNIIDADCFFAPPVLLRVLLKVINLALSYRKIQIGLLAKKLSCYRKLLCMN